MPTICSYQKYIDSAITRQLSLPVDADANSVGTELATLSDGLTYVSLPDGVALPGNQPAEIASTVASDITLTAAQRLELKAISPHCQLIDSRVKKMIRDKYTVDDEAYLSRIGIGVALGSYTFEPGEADLIAQYSVFVEGARQWGREQRALLGL